MVHLCNILFGHILYLETMVECRKFDVLGTRGIISSSNYREVDIKNIQPPKVISIRFFLSSICFGRVKEASQGHKNIQLPPPPPCCPPPPPLKKIIERKRTTFQMHIVVAYQKLCKIVLFIFIIWDKCNVFAQKFQIQ